MGKKLISDSILTSIANAIRTKLNTVIQYKPSEMADAILSIPQGGGGGINPSGTITVDENHRTYDCTQYAQVEVEIEDPTAELTIQNNGTFNVLGYKQVKVNVPVGVFPSGNLNISFEGGYDVREYETVYVDLLPTSPKFYIIDNDFVFIDDSGEPEFSYSCSEMSSKSGLPTPHNYGSGAVWNYTLEELKELAALGCPMVVGTNVTSNATIFKFWDANIDQPLILMYIYCDNWSGTVKMEYEVDDPIKIPPASTEDEWTNVSGLLRIPLFKEPLCRDIVTITTDSGSYSLGNPDGTGLFVEEYAAVGKSILKEVYIGSKCTKINDSCFSGCTHLDKVVFSGTNSVSGLYIGDYAFYKCVSIKGVTLPSYIKVAEMIQDQVYPFDDCNMNYISYPKTFTQVNNLYKSPVGGLRKFCISNQITALPQYVIHRFGLIRFVIPPSVTTMQNLGDISELMELIIKSNTLVTLTSSYLGNDVSSNLVIKVPMSLVDTYKSATNWSRYANQIVADT